MTSSGYRGQLEVIVTDKKGNTFIYDTPNIITYGAAKVAAHVLVGDTTHTVTKMAVGTGSTIPTRGDTQLQTQIFETTGFLVTYPQIGAPLAEFGQIQFNVILGNTHPTDGNILREVGLLTANNILVARQVHAPIAKDTMFKVEYRWRIVFT